MNSFISRAPVSERMRAIKTTLWIVFALNLVVALAKYIYGIISCTTSMEADGIHSIFDSAGNLVGLVGIMIAARPADDSHPYGHGKFETYASLVIGIMLILAAYRVGSTAIASLLSGEYGAQITVVSFIIMISTLIINICVTLYERRCGKRYHSEVLLADASHTLSDALVSTGVIIGLILVSAGIPQADPIMALVVTVAIIITAFDIFKRGLQTLSDHARIPEENIVSCASEVNRVREVHKVRTRGSDGEIYVDLHVLVNPDTTVLDAHTVSDEVEELIKTRFPGVCEVLVHIEPFIPSESLKGASAEAPAEGER